MLSARVVCERPEQVARFEQALAEVTGQRIRVEFAAGGGRADGRRPPAAPARVVSPHQRLLEVAQHPLVQRASELFGAQPVRVDDPIADRERLREAIACSKDLPTSASLLKQAQQIGGQMGKLTEEMKKRRVTGTAGGGMVEIEVNGLMEVLRCRIDPQLIAQDDREMLEDLVVAAVNQAIAKGKQMHADAMRDLTGGLPLPRLERGPGEVHRDGETDEDEETEAVASGKSEYVRLHWPLITDHCRLHPPCPNSRNPSPS